MTELGQLFTPVHAEYNSSLLLKLQIDNITLTYNKHIDNTVAKAWHSTQVFSSTNVEKKLEETARNTLYISIQYLHNEIVTQQTYITHIPDISCMRNQDKKYPKHPL